MLQDLRAPVHRDSISRFLFQKRKENVLSVNLHASLPFIITKCRFESLDWGFGVMMFLVVDAAASFEATTKTREEHCSDRDDKEDEEEEESESLHTITPREVDQNVRGRTDSFPSLPEQNDGS